MSANRVRDERPLRGAGSAPGPRPGSTDDEAGGPDAARGTYALLWRCERRVRLPVGRLGTVRLTAGHHVYVGSAFGPGGVRARVARHLRTDKPLHWHLDYLRASLAPVALCWTHAPERLEHVWAHALATAPGVEAVPGLGSSDCDCPSHFIGVDAALGTSAPLAWLTTRLRGSSPVRSLGDLSGLRMGRS